MNTVLFVYLVLGAVADLSDSKVITLGSHEGTTRVAISLDGKVAASTGDKTIRLWDTAKATPMHSIPIEEFGVALAFTPDKKAIAVRLENSVDLHDIESGMRIRRFDSHVDGVPRIAISPNGRLLVSGGSDNKARVWELTTGKLLHELAHEYHLVFGVHFSPDSQTLITGAGDGVATHGEVKSWKLNTGENMWRHEGKQNWMVAVLPDASAIVSADVEGVIVFHDWATGAERRRLKTSDSCRALAVSADGKMLAASSRNAIEIWSLTSGKPMSPLNGHQNWVVSLAFAPDGSAMVSGSSDDTVRLWRLP